MIDQNNEPILIGANEVCRLLNIKRSRAYAVIRQLNAQLTAQGKITIADKINKNILLIILANKEIEMVKRKHPCVYKGKNRNTYFVKKNYVDSLGKSQILFKLGFSSIKEAEIYLTDFMANHKNDCTKPLAAVIKDYLEYCEKEKDLRPSTLKTRTCILNTYILPYFGQTPINVILLLGTSKSSVIIQI